MLKLEATCDCGWTKTERVDSAMRTLAQKRLEWDAHMHETRNARRAYAHDTVVSARPLWA